MKMQNWLNARSAKLLEEINNIPFSDNSDDIKLRLILAAMRESSIEMFQRAAVKSRKEIEKIHQLTMQKSILDIEDIMGEDKQADQKSTEPQETVTEEKPSPKIKLSSSLVRRVDPY